MKKTVICMAAILLMAGCSAEKKDKAGMKAPEPKPVLVPDAQPAVAPVEAVSKDEVPAKTVEIKNEFGWQTEFTVAQQLARQKKLPILADFSGSDWCGWCIKLDKEVFSQDIFKSWAKDNVVLFLADFPRANSQPAKIKKQNSELMDKYGVEGFPSVLILDADGNMLQKTGYMEGGPQVYVDNLKVLLGKTSSTEKK